MSTSSPYIVASAGPPDYTAMSSLRSAATVSDDLYLLIRPLHLRPSLPEQIATYVNQLAEHPPSNSVIVHKASLGDGGEIVGFARWIRLEGSAAAPSSVGNQTPMLRKFEQDKEAVVKRIFGDDPHWYLGGLFVHPSHQRKGIAKLLLQSGFREIESRPAISGSRAERRISLGASPMGLKLYESVGFTERARIVVGDGRSVVEYPYMVREVAKEDA